MSNFEIEKNKKKSMASKRVTLNLGWQILIFLISIGVLLIIVNTLIYRSFTKEYTQQNKVYSVFHPSIYTLKTLNELNQKSVSLIKSWVFIDKDTGSIPKKEYKKFYKEQYPAIKQKIMNYTNYWDKDEQNYYYTILDAMDSMVNEQILITDELVFFEDYSNTEMMYMISEKISENGIIIEKSRRIEKNIQTLTSIFDSKIEKFNQQTKNSFLQLRNFISWITILMLFSLLIVGFYLYRTFSYISNTLINTLNKISKGNLITIKKLKRRDEIGKINYGLSSLLTYLKKNSDYATRLAMNDLATEFSSENENDTLGNSLLKIKNYLINTKKEEQDRQKENANRQWASQGIAEFNEVIRDHSQKLDDLTQAVVEKIVHYTNSNIGGLYVVNDESEIEKFLELKAFYAYDRFKYLNRQLKFGETLVGQCFVEKDIIYINDVPEDYLYITSGLGKDKPKSILIVPLIFNEVVHGVLELASLEEFADFKIDFVKRISETIASSISTVKINEKTKKLLDESNEKSKRLELQEIETREKIEQINKQIKLLEKKNSELEKEKDQLMEQLAEQQNNSDKKIKEIETSKEQINNRLYELFFVIDKAYPYFELSINDDIIFANELYLKIHNLGQQEVINVKHSKLLARDFVNTGGYKQIWDKIKQMQNIEASVQYLIEGKVKFYTETFIPIVDKENKIVKIAVIGRM